MGASISINDLPDTELSVGLGEVGTQSASINPMPVIVLIVAQPELPVIVLAVIAASNPV